jgi:hypothetical protein
MSAVRARPAPLVPRDIIAIRTRTNHRLAETTLSKFNDNFQRFEKIWVAFFSAIFHRLPALVYQVLFYFSLSLASRLYTHGRHLWRFQVIVPFRLAAIEAGLP